MRSNTNLVQRYEFFRQYHALGGEILHKYNHSSTLGNVLSKYVNGGWLVKSGIKGGKRSTKWVKKAASPVICNPSGKVMDVNLSQFPKALKEISFSELGRVTEAKEQEKNAIVQIYK